jgi:monoamine oxidase
VSLPGPVVVVGAGLSGLVAATGVVERGRDVVVLEASSRVGGRILNCSVGDDSEQVVENGAQWCGADHSALLETAASVGVSPFAWWNTGQSVWRENGQAAAYSGALPPFGTEDARNITATVEALDLLASGVSASAPWEAEDAERLDSTSLGQWLDDSAATPAARGFMELRMTLGFAVATERISLLHAAAFMASAGGWEGYLGRLKHRFRRGSQAIPDGLARELGDRVRLSEPVVAIVQDARRVRVVTTTSEFVADAVIVAVSPGQCRRIQFSPGLPPARAVLHNLSQTGTQLKAHFVYERPFWREQGLSGTSLSVGTLPPMTFDNTPPGGTPGVLGVLATVGAGPLEMAAHAVLLGDRNRRREAFAGGLSEMFGEQALRPVHYHEQLWAGDPMAAGCVNPSPPHLLTTVGSALREPVGRVHWAGTETADRWIGWMEGAVTSGRRASEEVTR